MNLGRCILNREGRHFRAIASLAYANGRQEGGSFVVTRLGARVQSVSPFPLTPALSPEERESPSAAVGYAHHPRFADRLARLLPLPWGEGWGEGARTVASRQSSDLLGCRLRSSSAFGLML